VLVKQDEDVTRRDFNLNEIKNLFRQAERVRYRESNAAVAQIWITVLISLTLNDSEGSQIDSSFFLAWGVYKK
jgi:hypothetical protein